MDITRTSSTSSAAWIATALGTLAGGSSLAGAAPVMSAPAAVTSAPVPAAPPHVVAKLIAEQAAATPGSVVTIGIDLTIEKKWHVYWNGRNDNGFAPNAEWTLPAGFTVDAFQWPAPVRHVDPGDLLNHVYFDRVTLLVPVHVPATAQPGTTATIKATVKWLVCNESCVGEEADLELALAIAKPGEPPAKSASAKLIEDARAQLPKELPAGSKDVAIGWSKEAVTVSVPGATHLEFYPDENCVPFARPIKDPVADAASLRIVLGDPEPEHTALAGVLAIRREKDKPLTWYHVVSKPPKAAGDAATPAPPTPPATPAASETSKPPTKSP